MKSIAASLPVNDDFVLPAAFQQKSLDVRLFCHLFHDLFSSVYVNGRQSRKVLLDVPFAFYLENQETERVKEMKALCEWKSGIRRP